MNNVAFARLERKIDTLIAILKPRKVWVKASAITALTKWNNEGMRTARENGYVEFEKREDGYWYNINSVSEKFISR